MSPEDLHWTESNIESVSVSGRCVSVVASSVFVLGQCGARRVRVTFTGVSRARREVTEYIGNPKSPQGFKQPYVIEEVEPLDMPSTKVFGLEGISTFEPVAWLDLEVRAQEASVEEL
jgi:hypothetical protein